MTNSQRLATVRRCLTNWLAQNASPQHLPGPGRPRFQESILICDGFYCGRRLDAGDYTAVWFLEEDELKISDAFGDLKCVLRGSEIAALAEEAPAEEQQANPARRAA